MQLKSNNQLEAKIQPAFLVNSTILFDVFYQQNLCFYAPGYFNSELGSRWDTCHSLSHLREKKLDDREERVKSVNSVSQTLTQRSDWMKSMNN